MKEGVFNRINSFAEKKQSVYEAAAEVAVEGRCCVHGNTQLLEHCV